MLITLLLWLGGVSPTPSPTSTQVKAVKTRNIVSPSQPLGPTFREPSCGIEFQHPQGWAVSVAGSKPHQCVLSVAPGNWLDVAARSELREPEAPLRVVVSSVATLESLAEQAGVTRGKPGQWACAGGDGGVALQADTWAGFQCTPQGRSYLKSGEYASVSELPVAVIAASNGLNAVVVAQSGGGTYEAFTILLRTLRFPPAESKP